MTSEHIRPTQSRRGYPSDLTDREWAIIERILNELDPYTKGRPRECDMRQVLNAIFYINKTGCQWRYLPNDFPPYVNVNYYYNKWTKDGTLEAINQALRQQLRQKGGRNPDPTGAIVDSQSVKGTPESQEDSGFDGGKLIKGRKRHLLVDTIGYIVAVWVHAANMFDGRAARRLLAHALDTVGSIRILWADSAYAGADLAKWLVEQYGCTLEVVKKPGGVRGFHVLPRRWVVERTFAWLGRSRRLSKDYERNPKSSEAQVYVASARLLIRQLTDNQISYNPVTN